MCATIFKVVETIALPVPARRGSQLVNHSVDQVVAGLDLRTISFTLFEMFPYTSPRPRL